MKHRKENRKFGRVRNQRKWLIRSLLSSLVIKGRLETSEAKAKEIKSRIDKIINEAKKLSESAKKITALRNLNKVLNAQALEKIKAESFRKSFSGRKSGYARVIKLPLKMSSANRKAIIELIKD